MITIAIANQKGGVGKTTSAVTLAHLWANSGMKVLLIDLDSQGNVADCLGLPPGHELADLLMPGINTWSTFPARENLDVMRLDKSGSNLKNVLAGETLRELILKNMLDGHDMDYDWCLLDCAPSVDLLQIMAICAAMYILIPTKLDQLAVKGVRDLLVSLANLKQKHITQGSFMGVLPTFYDRTTRETQDQFMHLVQNFGNQVMQPIPVDTSMRVATRLGKTILEYNPGSRCLEGIDDKKTPGNLGGYKNAMAWIEGYAWEAAL